MSQATILVVEDNALIRETTRAALEKVGYRVLEAANGQEAVEKARQHHPDLILLDMVMPELGGLEVIQRLRMDWETADAVIIVLSGTRTDDLSIERGLLEGADAYLTRPISNRVLLAFIRAHLRAKENERIARAREQQWRLLFEASQDGMMIAAREGYVLFANPVACHLLGLDPERARGTYLDPAWLDAERLEVRFPASSRILEIRSRAVTWEGEPAYLVVVRDLTSLYEMQEALRESEARFRRLAENAADLIYRYDFFPTPHFSYVNPAATAITGYTPEEHYADPDLGVKLVHPDDLPLLEQLRAGSLEAMRRPAVLRWVHKDGHTIWTEQRNVPVLDEEGRLIAIEGVARDITAQKEAELERERASEALAQQKRHLESVLAAIPEGVVVVDADGRVLLFNEAAHRYLEALLGPDWAQRPLQRLGDYSMEALRRSPTTHGWHEWHWGERIFEVKARPVINAVYGQTVLVLHEVTEQRRQEHYQRQQERMAVVGQLAAGITHDFNNIMTVVALYTQATLRLKGLSETARENLEIVAEEVQHATRLIQQILDFSRRSEMERRPLMLKSFVKELTKLLEHTLPETITVRLNYESEDDYTILGDPTRLQQALLNLVFNARDALEGRSSALLELTLARRRGPLVCHFCGDVTQPQEWIVLSVRDNGTGIPEAIIPHLFEPFFTTKPAGKGTGMGLLQVYGIVTSHEGHIALQTREGVGTTFTLYFPAYGSDDKAASSSLAQEVSRGSGQVILVVEDHEALRKALLNTLWEANYWALEASTGRQALEMMEQYPDIALVITDWVMPEMGGKALIEALRARGFTTPVIALTGHAVEADLEALRDELAGWLIKPVAQENLYRLIDKALHRGFAPSSEGVSA